MGSENGLPNDRRVRLRDLERKAVVPWTGEAALPAASAWSSRIDPVTLAHDVSTAVVGIDVNQRQYKTERATLFFATRILPQWREVDVFC
jgi:hypothetical protein